MNTTVVQQIKSVTQASLASLMHLFARCLHRPDPIAARRLTR